MSRQHEFLADHSTSNGQILPKLSHVMFVFLLLLAFSIPFCV